jgi:hypothetical protein
MKQFFRLLIGEDFTVSDIIPCIKAIGALLLMLSLITFIEKL